MKSMVLTGLNRIEIADRPIPELKNPEDVLIRMRSVGVCGSDIHYYSTGNIGSQVVKFPFTLGHEGAGVIEKTGNAVKTLKPGGRLMIIGIPSFRRWGFDVDNLRRKEISIQNVRRQNGVVEETIEMISDGRLNADRMQTHNFSLDDAGKAFELVAGYRDGVMKAMIHI
jgi:L-iditol 2-dehydrogenase